MNSLRHIFAYTMVVILSACAHPIVITPELAKLDRKDVSTIDKNVAYVISKSDRDKEVITPGGGGDKVKYYPYKELEGAIQKVLSNVFGKVIALDSIGDAQFIRDNNIKFLFQPAIKTMSSSPSAFTWPPTDFTVDLTCIAVDANGKEVWKKSIVGKGHAEFAEFKSDLSLSAKRASEDAFLQFQREINSSDEFRR